MVKKITNTFSRHQNLTRKAMLSFMAIVFFCQNLGLSAYAAPVSVPAPANGQVPGLSARFDPPVLRGIKIDPANPFKFDFIVYEGQNPLGETELKGESEKLIRYFLAGLTIPEQDLWVNLSPYEKDKIAAPEFSQTDIGRDMLAQDYLLKQLSSGLTYPQSALGKKFWDKVYARAQEIFGTTNLPFSTFNKIWIMPKEVVIFQDNDRAFVKDIKFKVLMEEDYLAMKQNNTVGAGSPRPDKFIGRGNRAPTNVSIDIFKNIILPVIEEEVNTGANFAPLRQLTYSLMLAVWFKQRLRATLMIADEKKQMIAERNNRLNVFNLYFDKNRIKGIETSDPAAREKIYQQYVEAYKKGAYDFIKKEFEANSKKPVRRRYFSGGVVANAVGTPLGDIPLQEYLEKNARLTNSASPAEKEMMAARTHVVTAGLNDANAPQLAASPLKNKDKAGKEDPLFAALQAFLFSRGRPGIKYLDNLPEGFNYYIVNKPAHHLLGCKTIASMSLGQKGKAYITGEGAFTLVRNMPDDSLLVASGIYSCASVGFFGSNGKDTVSGLGHFTFGIHDKTEFSDFVTPSQDIIAELPRDLTNLQVVVYKEQSSAYDGSVLRDFAERVKKEFPFARVRISEIPNGYGAAAMMISNKACGIYKGYIQPPEDQRKLLVKWSRINNAKPLRNATMRHDGRGGRTAASPIDESSGKKRYGTIEIVGGKQNIETGLPSNSIYTEGWDSDWHYQLRYLPLRSLLSLVKPQVLERITTGNILLLGPGRHVREIEMLMELFPQMKSLTVADGDWENLEFIRDTLEQRSGIDHNKIKLYHADFAHLPFSDGQFDLCYSHGVTDRTLFSPGKDDSAAFSWAGEISRTLGDNGIYFTTLSTPRFFEREPLTIKRSKGAPYFHVFAAAKSEAVFSEAAASPLPPSMTHNPFMTTQAQRRIEEHGLAGEKPSLDFSRQSHVNGRLKDGPTYYSALPDVLSNIPAGGKVLFIGPGMGFEMLDILEEHPGLVIDSVGIEDFMNDSRGKEQLTAAYGADIAGSKALQLEKLKQRFTLSDVDYGLPYADNSYDAIIMGIGVMPHIINQAGLVEDIYRVLKNHGKALAAIVGSKFLLTASIGEAGDAAYKVHTFFDLPEVNQMGIFSLPTPLSLVIRKDAARAGEQINLPLRLFINPTGRASYKLVGNGQTSASPVPESSSTHQLVSSSADTKQALASPAEDKLDKVKKDFAEMAPIQRIAITVELAKQGISSYRDIFKEYDPHYDAVTVDDRAMPIITMILTGKSAPAFNFMGAVIISETILRKAREGTRDSLLTIAHEHRHNDYLRRHSHTDKVEMILVNELYAYFASFIDIYGREELTAILETNDMVGTYVEIVTREIVQGYIYGVYKNQTDQQTKELLRVKATIAAHVINGFIKGLGPKAALPYILEAENFDTIIATLSPNGLEHAIKTYSPRGMPPIVIDNYAKLHKVYLEYKASLSVGITSSAVASSAVTKVHKQEASAASPVRRAESRKEKAAGKDSTGEKNAGSPAEQYINLAAMQSLLETGVAQAVKSLLPEPPRIIITGSLRSLADEGLVPLEKCGDLDFEIICGKQNRNPYFKSLLMSRLSEILYAKLDKAGISKGINVEIISSVEEVIDFRLNGLREQVRNNDLMTGPERFVFADELVKAGEMALYQEKLNEKLIKRYIEIETLAGDENLARGYKARFLHTPPEQYASIAREIRTSLAAGRRESLLNALAADEPAIRKTIRRYFEKKIYDTPSPRADGKLIIVNAASPIRKVESRVGRVERESVGSPAKKAKNLIPKFPEIENDHVHAYHQILEAVSHGDMPAGLPLILFDQRSDNRYYQRGRVLNEANWLTALQREKSKPIGDAFWIYPQERQTLIAKDKSSFKAKGPDFEEILKANLETLRNGVILSFDLDYFTSEKHSQAPRYAPLHFGEITDKIIEIFGLLSRYDIPVYLVNGAYSSAYLPRVIEFSYRSEFESKLNFLRARPDRYYETEFRRALGIMQMRFATSPGARRYAGSPAIPAPKEIPEQVKQDLAEAKRAVDKLLSRRMTSEQDDQIFKMLRSLGYFDPDSTLALLERLLSHPEGRIVHLASEELDRIMDSNLLREKILDIDARILQSSDEAAQAHVSNGELKTIAYRQPGEINMDMFHSLAHLFYDSESWPRRYAFRILTILISQSGTKPEVKSAAVDLLKESIEKEYKKAYADREDVGAFLDSWLNNNPFSLQYLQLENVPCAIREFRNLPKVTADSQTPYLTQNNGTPIPVAAVAMKDTHPDILEERFLHATVYANQNMGIVSEGIIPMRSKDFVRCHAVLIRNKNSGRYALFHFQYNAPEILGKMPFDNYINALGEGEKEAIYLGNSDAQALAAAQTSEAYLQSRFGIKTSRVIDVHSGDRHWALVFRPSTNQLIVYSEKEAYVFDAFENNAENAGGQKIRAAASPITPEAVRAAIKKMPYDLAWLQGGQREKAERIIADLAVANQDLAAKKTKVARRLVHTVLEPGGLLRLHSQESFDKTARRIINKGFSWNRFKPSDNGSRGLWCSDDYHWVDSKTIIKRPAFEIDFEGSAIKLSHSDQGQLQLISAIFSAISENLPEVVDNVKKHTELASFIFDALFAYFDISGIDRGAGVFIVKNPKAITGRLVRPQRLVEELADRGVEVKIKPYAASSGLTDSNNPTGSTNSTPLQKGGIDFVHAASSIKTEGKSDSLNLPVPELSFDDKNFTGFSFTILKIAKVTSLDTLFASSR